MAGAARQYGEPYRYGDEEKRMERLIFNRRPMWLVIIAVLTLYFGFEMTRIKIDARFEKMLPMQHEYLQNMFSRLDDLTQKGLSFKIAIENTQGDIFDKEYLQVVQNVHDKVFNINGVDRTSLRSMWAPSVRWQAVTPQGFDGDRLIPGEYDGSAESLERVKLNVFRSTEIGRLISDNFKSSIVEAYVYSTYPNEDLDRGHEAGSAIDFQDLGNILEETRTEINKQYGGKYRVYIIGEPKMIGDFIIGSSGIVFFGGIALLITIVLLYMYARCWRAALMPLFTSVIAVVWMLGILSVMSEFSVPYGSVLVTVNGISENIEIFSGIGMFSMLVPFLLVAIGVSHSVQYVNAMAVEMAHGHNKLQASKRAFRTNYLPGITALLTNAFSFLTMILIPISAIKELAYTACIGTAVLIVLKLMLLPILLSYSGIAPSGVKHMQLSEEKDAPIWLFLAKFTEARWAVVALVFAGALAVYSVYERQFLKIGDIAEGSPELRPDSTYNQDVKFITSNYATSSDLFVVMVTSAPGECFKQKNMEAMDDLEWTLNNTDGVQATASAAFVAKNFTAGLTEGHIKWMALGRNQEAIDGSFNITAEMGLANEKCSFAPVVAFLKDHKAETLDRVAKVVKDFADKNNTADVQFRLATGNAGIAAAVNQEIHSAQNTMLFLVYAVVAALVFFTFPSIKAMLCILGPLALTSILCEALMAKLGIGVKVATLPVITLGVGVGVDYGIYIYSRMESYFKEGKSLRDSYLLTLKTTGKAVSFTGMTLAIGVATWYWSAIQFQKDMGILLVFMFLWNMVGALTLLPALAHFLLPKGGTAGK
ncbi:MAG TPA: MMPL family transporter [Pseudomonadales bacterium]|jgi:predicted RND superfamily exporter protein|nr:RND family transporter [Cellvibrionales bacterium]HRF87788.1 MMPL family transporter [Pseudomonadales bacterium]HRG50296.1 MMPL family transporter [Pseudomonadales bacterium]